MLKMVLEDYLNLKISAEFFKVSVVEVLNITILLFIFFLYVFVHKTFSVLSMF